MAGICRKRLVLRGGDIFCHLRCSPPSSGNGSAMDAAEFYDKELTIMNSKALLAIVAGLVLALVLASCGGSDPTPTPTAAPTPTPTETHTPAPTPTATPAPPNAPSPTPTVAPTPIPIPALTGTPMANPTATPTPPPNPPPVARTIPEIIKELTPSVVHIQTEAVRLDQFNRPSPGVGVGTGEIIDEQGHVLTNNHVIEGV